MGCPVVTRAGGSHVSRVGVSLLTAVGLEEFICESRESYIEKAVELAGDISRLSTIRSSMRERLQKSALMNQAAFARDFEEGMLEMARVGGLVPRS